MLETVVDYLTAEAPESVKTGSIEQKASDVRLEQASFPPQFELIRMDLNRQDVPSLERNKAAVKQHHFCTWSDGFINHWWSRLECHIPSHVWKYNAAQSLLH
jgi:hypothetical protein